MDELTLTGKLVGWEGGDVEHGIDLSRLLIELKYPNPNWLGAFVTFCNPHIPLDFLNKYVLYKHDSRGQVLIAGEIDESDSRNLGIKAGNLSDGKPAILKSTQDFHGLYATKRLVEYFPKSWLNQPQFSRQWLAE